MGTRRRGDRRSGAALADATPIVLAGDGPRRTTVATGGGDSPGRLGALTPLTAGINDRWVGVDGAAGVWSSITARPDASTLRNSPFKVRWLSENHGVSCLACW